MRTCSSFELLYLLEYSFADRKALSSLHQLHSRLLCPFRKCRQLSDQDQSKKRGESVAPIRRFTPQGSKDKRLQTRTSSPRQPVTCKISHCKTLQFFTHFHFFIHLFVVGDYITNLTRVTPHLGLPVSELLPGCLELSLGMTAL